MDQDIRGDEGFDDAHGWDESGLGDRISAVADLYGTRRNAALAAGSSEDMLQAYIKGTSKVPLGRMAALCLGQGISLDWLATGQGQWAIRDRSSLEVSRPSGSMEPLGDFVLVPHYGAITATESGSQVSREGVLGEFAFRGDWLQKTIGGEPVDLGVVEVAGDSMEPTLRHGEKVLVDLSVTAMIGDGIYLLQDDDLLVVKRLQRVIGSGILVRSDNPAYATYEVPQSKAQALRIVAQVRHLIGRKL